MWWARETQQKENICIFIFVSSFCTWRLKNLDELIEVRKVTTDLEQEVTVGWDDPESVFRRMLESTKVFMGETMFEICFKMLKKK